MTNSPNYGLLNIYVKERLNIMAGSKMSKEDLQVWLAVNAAATKKSVNKKKYNRKKLKKY